MHVKQVKHPILSQIETINSAKLHSPLPLRIKKATERQRVFVLMSRSSFSSVGHLELFRIFGLGYVLTGEQGRKAMGLYLHKLSPRGELRRCF